MPPTLFLAFSLPLPAVFPLRENPRILAFEVHSSVVFDICMRVQPLPLVIKWHFHHPPKPVLTVTPTVPLATQMDFMSLWICLFVAVSFCFGLEDKLGPYL